MVGWLQEALGEWEGKFLLSLARQPRGFSGKGCLPRAGIFGVESGDALHFLGHHILGDAILPEQTLRCNVQVPEGWGGTFLEGPGLPHTHMTLIINGH